MKPSYFYGKGQGLPLTTIIIAATGLIVLVVTVIIFTRETGETSGTLKDCETQGGFCTQNRTSCINEEGRPFAGGHDSCEANDNGKPTCCMKLSA